MAAADRSRKSKTMKRAGKAARAKCLEPARIRRAVSGKRGRGR